MGPFAGRRGTGERIAQIGAGAQLRILARWVMIDAPAARRGASGQDDRHDQKSVNADQKALYVHPALVREGEELGSFSLTHWLVVLAIILILFGAGKLPRVMGDFAKGIKNFKTGMKDDDDLASSPAKIEDAAEATDRKA
jgi:sec-independent protein translocase protein TatA